MWVVFYNTIPRKECTEDNVERIDANGHNEPARNARMKVDPLILLKSAKVQHRVESVKRAHLG